MACAVITTTRWVAGSLTSGVVVSSSDQSAERRRPSCSTASVSSASTSAPAMPCRRDGPPARRCEPSGGKCRGSSTSHSRRGKRARRLSFADTEMGRRDTAMRPPGVSAAKQSGGRGNGIWRPWAKSRAARSCSSRPRAGKGGGGGIDDAMPVACAARAAPPNTDATVAAACPAGAASMGAHGTRGIAGRGACGNAVRDGGGGTAPAGACACSPSDGSVKSMNDDSLRGALSSA